MLTVLREVVMPVAHPPALSHSPSATGASVSPLQRLPSWATLAVLFGILGAVSIALFGPIGVSGTYPRLVGGIASLVAPAASRAPYLVKMGSLLAPETMIVVGLVIGGFLAARFGRRAGVVVPAQEVIHAHESTSARRYAGAFAGGILIIFGARLAGGCTSGHIISGITQLSLSGLVFAAGVFATGLLTARLLKQGY